LFTKAKRSGQPAQPQGEPGFLSARVVRVQHAGLGRLVESGGDRAQGGGRLAFLPRCDQSKVVFLQRFEARLEALIVQVPGRAAAHAAFG